MRSFKSLSVLGFVLLACFSLLVIGCGSDDPPTKSNVGSLTDPNFVAVQEQVETLVDSTIAIILTGMQSASSISTGGEVLPFNYGPLFTDSNQISISYVNGWHIVNLTHSNVDFAFNVSDSIQFYNNDEISQLGVEADSIFYRHRWSYEVENKNVSYTELEGASGFDFRGLDGATAVIDGSNDFVIDNQVVTVESTVFRHFESSTTVENLSVNKTGVGWVQSCPNSGTITSTMSMLYSKDDATPISSEWHVSITFTDGSAAVSVTSAGLVWSYTSDVCTAI